MVLGRLQQQILMNNSQRTFLPSAPLQHAPDSSRNNRIANTSSPIRQVKQYLQSIKQSHRQHQQQSQSISQLQISNCDETQNSYSIENMLRKRIAQLQLQNNQYKTYAIQYQKINMRNTELQQQMMMLMQQLQSQAEEKVQTEHKIYQTQHINSQETHKKYHQGTTNKHHHFNTNESEEYSSEEEIQSIIDKYSLTHSIQPFAGQTSDQSAPSSIIQIATSMEQSTASPDHSKIQKHQLAPSLQKLNPSTQDSRALLEEMHRRSQLEQMNNKALLDQNQFLKSQNIRIKEVIQDTIRQSIVSMQQKFSSYVSSMQQKLTQMNLVNSQIAKMHIKSQENRSKSSSLDSALPGASSQQLISQNSHIKSKSGKKYKNNSQSRRSLSNSQTDSLQKQQVNIPQTILKQTNTLGVSNEHMKKQNSMIHIELSMSHASSQSRGYKQTPRSHGSNYFRNIAFVQSEQSSDPILPRIFQNLATLRYNLSSLFNQSSSTLRQSPIKDFARKVQKELKDIIVQYFPKDNEALLGQDENLLSQSIQMRQKISDLTHQITSLKRDLKVKVDEDLIQSPFRRASQKYLEECYYFPMQQERQQFEQTKRKLRYVISVMKGFNEDYQHLLSHNHSHRTSIFIESIQAY